MNLPHRVRWLLLALLLLALGLWQLDGPPMWWDEGWTLSVARNWAETGHYVRLRDGLPLAPGLEAAFPVTLPVGIIMRLLGVGLWQGRLFGVLCSVVVLMLLAILAEQLYDRKVALAALVAALLLTPHPQINALIQGRQVLAELPMLAYLLAGYLLLWWALAGRSLAILPAVLLFGTAWISKGQTGPFLALSLAVPCLAALAQRRWRTAATMAATLAGSYLVARQMPLLVTAALFDPNVAGDPVTGLVEVVAVVFTPFNRVYALTNLLIFGLPTLLSLLWALPALWRAVAVGRGGSDLALGPVFSMKLALFTFVASWLGWFVGLSVGVPRYLFPPVLISCIFLAGMLRDATADFDFVGSLGRAVAFVSLRKPTRAGAAALGALLLATATLALTGLGLIRYYPEQDHSAQRVAAAIDAMPFGTRVETYETELHFLLHQPYHYPPDQVHVELNHRSLLGEQTSIAYDPLAGNPDVLVVGDFARGNDLYTPILAGKAFRLLMRDGTYEVYQRVR